MDKDAKELEDFKSRIDLRQYAASMGYTLDRRESWRGNAVMRNAANDKIIIKIEGDGHWVYCSCRENGDDGTIIDFVQRRRGLTVGKLRQHLRPWIGKAPVAVSEFARLEPVPKDLRSVGDRYGRMKSALRHPYLEKLRGIPASLLSSCRFAGRVKIDGYGNAVFPHFNLDGDLCGYELRNRTFQGFAKGGEKGLWISHGFDADERLVLCESGIEALSYAVLFPDSNSRYGSLGGRPNPEQMSLIAHEIVALPFGEIVAAMNADSGGRQLRDMVQQVYWAAERQGLSFRTHEPDTEGYDWNEVLKSMQASFPAAQVGG